MVLKCTWTIELNWVEKYGERREKYTFWAFSGDMYRYTFNVYRYTLPELNVYRYMLGVYGYTLLCFPNFDQVSYFGNNLLNPYPIYVIQVAN